MKGFEDLQYLQVVPPMSCAECKVLNRQPHLSGTGLNESRNGRICGVLCGSSLFSGQID